jgi:malate dehydrogenase
MSTVAILGAGELGGATAHALAARGSVSRVLLIDLAGQVAAGKALDIQQAGAISAFPTRLDGTTDPTRVTGCSVCVVADRAGPGSTEWQRDDGLETVARFARDAGTAPLVFAGSAQEALMRALAREAGVQRRRLIGSAPEALAAAVRAMVAVEAGCSVTEVSLSVLGRAPRGTVVPWVEASIAGYALEKVLTQAQLARVEARLPRLWPPGPYTLGLAAADVVDAIVRSSRRPRCVTAVLDGEFGARGQAGAVPAYLGPSGIERTVVPVLNTRERVQVEAALDT